MNNRYAAVCPSAPYIDTVELFFRQVPIGMRKQIEDVTGKRLRIRSCGWGYRICLNQPGAALPLLAVLQRQHKCCLSRVDIALDIAAASAEQAQAIQQTLEQHLVLRWRRAGPMHRVGGTVYWSPGRANRNLVLYADRPARTGTSVHCAHLELRFHNAGSVRRAPIESIAQLADLDLMQILRRHIKFVDFDPDAVAQQILRRTIAAERRQFLQRGHSRDHALVEQYRANLPHRVKHLIKRAGLHTAQVQKGITRAHTVRGCGDKSTYTIPNLKLFFDSNDPEDDSMMRGHDIRALNPTGDA